MPLLEGKNSRAKPHKVIEYIMLPTKAAVSETLNMSLPQGADDKAIADAFEKTAKTFNKWKSYKERKYYHYKFSPNRQDNVSPEACQAAAMELARELFPGHEMVIATHVDTRTVHSHIIINSVNFKTGLSLDIKNREYVRQKDFANEIGLKYGMTPLDWRDAVAVKRQMMAEGKLLDRTAAEKRILMRGGISWKEELREVIDLAKEKCDNIIEFEDFLADYGVTLPRCSDNTISYLHPKRQKPARGFKLGEGYTAEAINRCFEQKRDTVRAESINPTPYLKRLLDTKHLLMMSDREWVDYCNVLSERVELKLFLQNAAVDSTDELSFSVVLERDYGVTKTTLADGTVAYHVKSSNKIIPASDLGIEYINRKEILNGINKQTHGAYSSRGEATDLRAGADYRSFGYGDGERRAVDAEGVKQTTVSEANGLQEHHGQAVSAYTGAASFSKELERGNAAYVIGYDEHGDNTASRSDIGALRANDGKLPNNGQSGAAAIGGQHKAANTADGDKGRDKGRS